MKKLIYIFLLFTWLGCLGSAKKDVEPSSKRMKPFLEPDKGLEETYENMRIEESRNTIFRKCDTEVLDFLKLNDDELQTDFFFKLDSIRFIQYPNNDQETSIMVDITLKYLKKFLSDIDVDSLRLNNRFEKEYHFNIAPKGFTDPKKCKDKIELSFDKVTCQFRLNVYNTFLVEPDWCTESMVTYGFNILNGKIIDFWRQEAG